MNIFYLRSNPVNPDPRVEKEVSALLEHGHQVTILCWDRDVSISKSSILTLSAGSCVVERFGLRSSFGGGMKNLFKLIFFQFFLLFKLLVNIKKIDAIHAADFDTVLPAVLMKFFFRKKVIYDVYDFYVDAFPVPHHLRGIVKFFDLKVMGYVDAVIITNESRLRQIEGARPKRLIVVHNTPEERRPFVKKDAHAPYEIVVAYVGILQPGRLLLEIAEGFKKNPGWKLVIAGFGSLEEQIRQISNQYENIDFLGRVDYATGLEISASADILFATYDPQVPNHKYSSPNKLYEAMMLSKPLIACRGTGVDIIVEAEKMGCVVDYSWPSFKSAVQIFADNKEILGSMSGIARKLYVEKFSWAVMKERLIDLYGGLA